MVNIDDKRFVLLFRLHSRSKDINKQFYNKLKKYGGSKRDFILLMGYHSVNRNALNLINELIEADVMFRCDINDNGNYDWKIDYKKLSNLLEKFPAYNSVLGEINSKYSVLGDFWNG